ncbi:MAG TPA: MerR family transcriptional regulator [Candidatus Paceibacterota bacterium]|nr:MerR family transcriptional regulator [Verrucomicrobiota bacterium]HRY46718.1 MerR family transcriptional regulator [Candidatus Paceibacterota bacterium]HSA00631.1 MerR family transcriptional regulator [Candidatus Paceibacterota bacterium]
MPDAHHPIQLAARLTGLSTHVIRIWEQRYHAVEPKRTPSNHRLYSDADIERLSLLRDATRAGHNISQVARLSNDKLRALAASVSGQKIRPGRGVGGAPAPDAWLEEALNCVRSLDGRALDDTLKRATMALGAQGVLHRLVAPLTQILGDLWREGEITAAHEHFATGHIRAFLINLAKPFGGREGGPTLVVGTPAGQLHEMGALLAGALAANLGWQVTSLGASLPAAEIAGAARQKRARAVALSLVYPEDDASLPGELTLLRDSLPAETALVVGGRAMHAYRETLLSLGVILAEDLVQLGLALDRLRKTA